MKSIYNSVNEEAALENLLNAKEKWGKKYPNAIKSWEDNWDNLVTFFAFPDNIRRIMYTTNAIESLNSQFRKVTKTKLIFPNDESLMKMLYLVTNYRIIYHVQRDILTVLTVIHGARLLKDDMFNFE